MCHEFGSVVGSAHLALVIIQWCSRQPECLAHPLPFSLLISPSTSAAVGNGYGPGWHRNVKRRVSYSIVNGVIHVPRRSRRVIVVIPIFFTRRCGFHFRWGWRCQQCFRKVSNRVVDLGKIMPALSDMFIILGCRDSTPAALCGVACTAVKAGAWQEKFHSLVRLQTGATFSSFEVAAWAAQCLCSYSTPWAKLALTIITRVNY